MTTVKRGVLVPLADAACDLPWPTFSLAERGWIARAEGRAVLLK